MNLKKFRKLINKILIGTLSLTLVFSCNIIFSVKSTSGDINSNEDNIQPPVPRDSAGWLYTSGNKIYISDGIEVTQDEVFSSQGVNIFDTRANGSLTNNEPDVERVKRTIDVAADDWGVTFFRLCLESHTQAEIDQFGLVKNCYSFTEDTDYLNDIVEIVEYISETKGLYVLVSLWWEPTAIPKFTDPDGGFPTEATAEAWYTLAKSLAPYKGALFGICNEPEFINDPTNALDESLKAIYQKVIDKIRQAEYEANAPQHIIAVQGRNWAHELEYFVRNPFDNETNIAYETHMYQSEDQLDHFVGNPSRTLPVIIGEFGPAEWNGSILQSQEDAVALMEYAGERQIPFTAWAFDDTASPILISDNDTYEPTDWGVALMRFLGKNDSPTISNASVSPYPVYNDGNTEVVLSVKAQTVKTPSDLLLSADLRELGGRIDEAMQPDLALGPDMYSCSYIVPVSAVAGERRVIIKAVDVNDVETTKDVTLILTQYASVNLDLFTENNNLITGSWQPETIGNLEIDNSIVNDGSEAYRFTYDFSSGDNWSAFNLQFDAVDLPGYKTIQFAVRYDPIVASKAEAQFGFYYEGSFITQKYELVNNGNTDYSGIYHTINVPVSDFLDNGMNYIDAIAFFFGTSDSNDDASKKGVLWIDSIKLLAY